MKNSLFSSDVTPKCVYCQHGRVVNDGKEVLCYHRGVMLPNSNCKKYAYDPFKRIPMMIKVNTDFKSEDFSL